MIKKILIISLLFLFSCATKVQNHVQYREYNTVNEAIRDTSNLIEAEKKYSAKITEETAKIKFIFNSKHKLTHFHSYEFQPSQSGEYKINYLVSHGVINWIDKKKLLASAIRVFDMKGNSVPIYGDGQKGEVQRVEITGKAIVKLEANQKYFIFVLNDFSKNNKPILTQYRAGYFGSTNKVNYTGNDTGYYEFRVSKHDESENVFKSKENNIIVKKKTEWNFRMKDGFGGPYWSTIFPEVYLQLGPFTAELLRDKRASQGNLTQVKANSRGKAADILTSFVFDIGKIDNDKGSLAKTHKDVIITTFLNYFKLIDPNAKIKKINYKATTSFKGETANYYEYYITTKKHNLPIEIKLESWLVRNSKGYFNIRFFNLHYADKATKSKYEDFKQYIINNMSL